ncbi:DUF427 domain-containing protein [Profundibacterium mesophilum]|nr:DUF427 domain-containing protein [Profundibacterium mesophilum]
MSDHIVIEEAGGTWVVRAGGAVIGESSNALVLREGDLSDVIYFPKDDIATAFLDPTDHESHCPHKGDASYYDIQTKSVSLKNAAWSYESPSQDVARIAGHIAFYPDKATVEQV